MKKSLLIIAMMMTSAGAFAAGSSSITGASFGGYATGDEANTAGGFCSGSGAVCNTYPPVTTTMPNIDTGLLTSASFGANFITGVNSTAPVLTGNALESASGAGINATTPATAALGLIDTTTTTTPATSLGTYTALEAVSVGAYSATTAQDPTAAGNTTGNVSAIQKPEFATASSNNTTSSTANAYRGQAATFSGIAGTAQAAAPYFAP